jgi:AraC-like DNA-binding protein
MHVRAGLEQATREQPTVPASRHPRSLRNQGTIAGSDSPPARLDINRAGLAFLGSAACLGHSAHVYRQKVQRLGITITSFSQAAITGAFSHRSSLACCGELILLASAHTGLSMGLRNEDDGAVVMLPYGGHADVTCQGHPFKLQNEAELAYLPVTNLQLQTNDFNGVIFRIDRQRLQSTAESLIGPYANIPQLRKDLRTPRTLGCDSTLNAELVLQLRRTVQMLDAPGLQGSTLLDALRLDELIYRILAELVSTEVNAHPEPVSADTPFHQPMRDQIFEDLIAWINSNLDRPIGLGELEERSAYSRRSLQYSFKRRFGCSPMHWIRHQRLRRALWQLQHPEPETSVRTVAMACGYTHLSAFGRDFRNHFDLRASEVLRQARQLREQDDSPSPPSLTAPAAAP